MGKDVKIAGLKKYIDAETGKEEYFLVEKVKVDRRYGWEAIWLSTLLETIEIVTNKGFKVVKFLLSKRIRSENLVVATIRQIAKDTGLSEKTVRSVIKKLLEANFMTRVQKGVYRINPAVIWKGYENKRKAILIKFTEENDKAEESDKGRGVPNNGKQNNKRKKKRR